MIASLFPQRTAPAMPLPRHDAASSCTVLLVDDDKDALDKLAKQLRDAYCLLMATSERSALHIIETHSVQLIISKIDLNRTDGCGWCTLLKSSPRFSHIPLILLMTRDTVAARIKSLESGADACIERSVPREYLQAQINSLLSNRARIKDYFAHSIYAHMNSAADSKENDAFLRGLNGVISDHLRNMDLNVDTLARLMHMSRPTFYRKLKSFSDLTPNELINVARLNKAAELISTSSHKVFEVAKMVGFNSQSNFGKAFLKQFNLTPTAYQRKTQRQIAQA